MEQSLELINLLSALLGIGASAIAVLATRASLERAIASSKERSLRAEVSKVLGSLAQSDVPLDELARSEFYSRHREFMRTTLIQYFDSVPLTKYVKDPKVRSVILEDVAFASKLVGND